MPSCVFITTYYSEFIKALYTRSPHLIHESYAQQKAALLDTFFGDSDFYSRGLSDAGWQADDIIMNCAPLQNRWAKENDFSGAGLDIVVEQIRRTKPEVIYLHDLNYVSTDFITQIRPYTKLIVGQAGSPVPPKIDMSLFDIIFSCVPYFVEGFRSANIASYYQPLAFESRITKRIKESAAKEFPVSFIGGVVPAVHKSRQELLLALGNKIKIDYWGYGKEFLNPDSYLVKNWRGEAWGLDMFQVLEKSLITINCHVDAAKNYAANMRLFEATGCGALLITDYKDNLNDLFEIGKEVVAYRSPEECASLIIYYQSHPEKALEIARAGRRRTLKDHSYSKRMADVAEILERHIRYQDMAHNASGIDLSKINYGHTSIQPDQISKKMTSGWKSAEIPEKQRALVQRSLETMYRGTISPMDSALKECMEPYIFSKPPVLEIGCASGYYFEILEYILNRKIDYTGVDYSAPLISMAKNYYPRAKFYVADGAHLPFENEQFPMAISSCILLHVPNWQEHIKETVRVSQRVVIVHRTPVCRKRPTQYLKKFAYGVETVELTFNEEELLSQFKKNGLTLITSNEYYTSADKDYSEVTYLLEKRRCEKRSPLPDHRTEKKESTPGLKESGPLKMMNLGCGSHFHPDWTNIDFHGAGPGVKEHNLLKGIPEPDNSFHVVYHANFLEHFSKRMAPAFIRECFRVLTPGGIIRVAVPDLEDVVKQYLTLLKKSLAGDLDAQNRYEWIMIELFDQMTRNQSGGEMFEYWKKSPMPAHNFVIDRCGPQVAATVKHIHNKGINTLPHEDLYVKAARDNDPESIKKMADFRTYSGEVHQWMYDRYSLAKLLREAGFREIKTCTAEASMIPGFNTYHLDVHGNGQERKPASLYMEALK